MSINVKPTDFDQFKELFTNIQLPPQNFSGKAIGIVEYGSPTPHLSHMDKDKQPDQIEKIITIHQIKTEAFTSQDINNEKHYVYAINALLFNENILLAFQSSKISLFKSITWPRAVAVHKWIYSFQFFPGVGNVQELRVAYKAELMPVLSVAALAEMVMDYFLPNPKRPSLN